MRYFFIAFPAVTVFFTPGVVAVSKSVKDSGRERVVKLCGRFSEYKMAAKGWLDRLIGDAPFSAGTSAAILETGETDGASGVGLSKVVPT